MDMEAQAAGMAAAAARRADDEAEAGEGPVAAAGLSEVEAVMAALAHTGLRELGLIMGAGEGWSHTAALADKWKRARLRMAALYVAVAGLGRQQARAARALGMSRRAAAHAMQVMEEARDEAEIDEALERLEARAERLASLMEGPA
jgi:hypothetical protein